MRGLSALQKAEQVITGKTGFSEKGEKSAFGKFAIMPWHHGAAFRGCVVVDEMLPEM